MALGTIRYTAQDGDVLEVKVNGGSLEIRKNKEPWKPVEQEDGPGYSSAMLRMEVLKRFREIGDLLSPEIKRY